MRLPLCFLSCQPATYLPVVFLLSIQHVLSGLQHHVLADCKLARVGLDCREGGLPGTLLSRHLLTPYKSVRCLTFQLSVDLGVLSPSFNSPAAIAADWYPPAVRTPAAIGPRRSCTGVRDVSSPY